MMCVCMMVFKVPTSHPIVNETKEAARVYTTLFKDKDAETKMQLKERVGPMGVHIFNGIMSWVLKDKDIQLNSEQAERVKEAKNTWEDWKYVMRHVPHSKVVKSVHVDMKELEIALSNMIHKEFYAKNQTQDQPMTPMGAFILLRTTAFEKHDVRELAQRLSPRGNLERKLQRMLDTSSSSSSSCSSSSSPTREEE